MTTIVDSDDQTMFAIKINGVIKGTSFSDRMSAEMAKMQMVTEVSQETPDVTIEAEVVPVNHDGKELLLG